MVEVEVSVHKCLCGSTNATLWSVVNGVFIVTCSHCGIRRSESTKIFPSFALEGARRTLPGIRITNIGAYNDPCDALALAHGLLRRDGILTVTAVDIYSADAARDGLGFKHITAATKWYLSKDALIQALSGGGFVVLSVETGSGLVTVTATPAARVEDIIVFGPPGIGDTLWTLNKLKAIRSVESPCRLTYTICTDTSAKSSDRATDLLKLCPLIDHVEVMNLPLPADTGNSDPRVPVYNLVANHFLEPNKPGTGGGKRIEDWRPELRSDFETGIEIPAAAGSQATALLGKGVGKYAVVYFSSTAWNDACTANQAWFPKDWAKLCLSLYDAGIKPVVLGSEWDADYFAEVEQALKNLAQNPADVWINLVGNTPLTVAMAVMESAAVTVGICAGLPMLAAYFGWPTVILWPKAGVLKRPILMNFKKQFQTNWVPPKVLESGTYVPLSFGEFTADTVMRCVRGEEAVGV